MRARAPASAANLGPGFDTLALALALYVDVEVAPAARLSVTTDGEGADLPADAGHPAVRVAVEVAGHDRLAVTVRSSIPLSRGLGSSAALAAAAAAAAGAPDPLSVAAAVDGHPENAAASVLGGLVAATLVDGRPVAVPLPLDASLVVVALVSDRPLDTRQAREALPTSVTHADAAFNVGRMGLLLAGLADHRLLVPAATDDRLHQPARLPLFPESAALLDGLVAAGALASSWSGAGPTLVGLCTRAAAGAVEAGGRRLLREAGVPGRVLVLEPDRRGLRVEDARPRR